MSRRSRWMVATLLALLVAPSAAQPCWIQDGVLLTPPGSNEGILGVVSDGAGGAILLHTTDLSPLTDSGRAQRFGADGCPQWSESTHLGQGGALSGFGGSLAIPDGLGGALTCWSSIDCSFGCPREIRIQRVGPSGAIAPGWPPEGRLLPKGHVLAADGSGGVYVGFHQSNTARVLRLDATGQLADGWTLDGRSYDDSYATVGSVEALVADGGGGVIMIGIVAAAGSPPTEIRAQRFDADGARLWINGGVTLSAPADQQAHLCAVSDGAGGAVIAWNEDPTAGSFEVEVDAQRVIASGTVHPAWPADGVHLSLADVSGGVNGFGGVWIAMDGSDGAIVAWNDRRNYATSGADLYAQRVNGDGAIPAGWTAGGTAVSTASGDQVNAERGTVLPDGSGGAYLVWEDGSDGRIHATRLEDDGSSAPGWAPGGNPVTAASDSGHVLEPTAVIAPGSLIVFWHHVSNYQWIYMTKLVDGHAVDVPAASRGVGAEQDSPELWLASENPSMRGFEFGLELSARTMVQVAVFDGIGRRIRTLASTTFDAGTQRVHWDGRDASGADVAAGTYFVRAEARGVSAVQRCTVLR